MTYNHPELTMECLSDLYSPFTDPPSLTCDEYSGRDEGLDLQNPVSKFEFCGRKVSPHSKSVTATIEYSGDQQDCDTDVKDQLAFERYLLEVDLNQDGILASYVDCTAEPTGGYTLEVQYSVDYVHLSDLDYLDLTELADLIATSDGDASRKRALGYQFESVQFSYTLDCPLEAPAFNSQCGE